MEEKAGKLIPRSGYILVESLPDDFRNSSLEEGLRPTLIIPDCAKETSRLAKVVALGQGKGYTYSVKVGDMIFCQRYPQSFQGFEWQGRQVGVMRESEMLAIVEVSNAL